MENKRTDFVKIRVFLPGSPVSITSNGPRFSDEFMDRLYNVEEDFRNHLIIPLNEWVGLHNWAIRFVKVFEKQYFADTYAENEGAFATVKDVVNQIMPDFQFTFYWKGTIDDYLATD
jgi:hypothetical protein